LILNTDDRGGAGGVTVSQALGEITWLLSQSPLHRAIQVADLGWLVMPAIVRRQFHLFRDGERPVGVALWALVNENAARKIRHGVFKPENQLQDADWSSGDTLWLVDLVAPFASPQNRHREIMFGDLVTGVFAGRHFYTQQFDPASGQQRVVEVTADTSARLVADLKRHLGAEP